MAYLKDLGPRPLILDLARYFGGAEVHVLDLAAAFAPYGGRVACLRNSILARRLKAARLEPIELPVSKVNPHMASLLTHILREGDFNIMDAHNVQSYFWMMASQPRRQIHPALVATVHSSSSHEHRNPVKRLLYSQLERYLLPHFDQVVTVSDSLRSELENRNIPAEQVSLVPNGVSLEGATPVDGNTIRAELGLSPDQQVIGTIGRLEPAKGHVYLLGALSRLLPAWPRLHCIVVGEGRLFPELNDFVLSHGLGEHVQFTGFRNDVMRLLEALDVFVLPSITEGIPYALLEACASARPIVASRVGGVPEVISDGRSGCLVQAGDVEGLAAAIDGLLRNRQQAEQMGLQARQDVAARYSMTSMVQGTWQAYGIALQRRETRPS